MPTYEKLAREDYINSKKIAPGIKREYTRFVLSHFYMFQAAYTDQQTTDGANSLQHLGGGLQPLQPPPPPSAPPPCTGGTTMFGAPTSDPSGPPKDHGFMSPAQIEERTDISVAAELDGLQWAAAEAEQRAGDGRQRSAKAVVAVDPVR